MGDLNSLELHRGRDVSKFSSLGSLSFSSYVLLSSPYQPQYLNNTSNFAINNNTLKVSSDCQRIMRIPYLGKALNIYLNFSGQPHTVIKDSLVFARSILSFLHRGCFLLLLHFAKNLHGKFMGKLFVWEIPLNS